jgi:hypothetical protein
MTKSVAHALRLALCVGVLSLAATGARATVITYDTSPVGGPPVSVDDFDPAANPVITGGTIVDLGGGDHAVSLPVLISPGGLPYQAFLFEFQTWYPWLGADRTEYDWQLNSFDVWVDRDTDYRLGFYGGITGAGVLPANQWTTLSVNSSFWVEAIFGPTFNPGAVLLDNVNYSLVGSHVVPEPATWAMLIVGFGMLGAAMRRRRPADRPAG